MTTTYRHAAAAPRRRLRAFWFLGVALLAVSAVGAGVALHSQGSGSPDSAPAAGEASGGYVVVATGHVDSAAEIRALSPLQPGRVARILVVEGQEVEKDAVLLEMDDYVATREVQRAKAAYESAEEQVKQAEEASQRHPIKIQEQEQAIAAAEHNFRAAEHEQKRAQGLADLNQSNTEIARAASERAAALEAAWKAEQLKLNELKLYNPQIDLDRARKEVEAKKAVWEQAEYALKECRLVAPMKGTILRVLANASDLFGPQSKQPALFFCPAGTRIVRAEVEQEFAGRVKLGMPATIEDDTTARMTWHGKVVRVGDWFTQRRSILPEPVQLHDVRTLECIVELDANQPMPRINQRMRVTLGK